MRQKTKELCYIALSAAVLCLVSPWAVPIGGFPVTLSLFAVLLTAELFPIRIALPSVTVYVALGAVGIPVFAGFTGGFQVLAGPTGGFILSYFLIATIVSLFGKGFVKSCIFGVLSTILCYILGSLWLSFTTSTDFLGTLALTAGSYAIPDTFKMIAAATLSDILRKRLKKTLPQR